MRMFIKYLPCFYYYGFKSAHDINPKSELSQFPSVNCSSCHFPMLVSLTLFGRLLPPCSAVHSRETREEPNEVFRSEKFLSYQF